MTRLHAPRSGTLPRLRALVAVVAMTLVLAGCDFSVYKMPLPGGTDTGEDPIEVTAKFRDVLDLVPQSTVKLNDVTVGKVTDVSLDGYLAEVTMELRKDVEVPDNAWAQLRQTSLLGEKFVSLEVPEEQAASPDLLEDGDVIGLDRSGRNPEVEEVLGAMALLLNGGGVAQLKTITHELNQALQGREGTARSLLSQVRTLMAQLDRGKQDIVAAIEALNRLSTTANGQMDTIDAALAELPGALDTINEQRDELISMLQALDELSDVGTRVIRESKDATIASLRSLDPVLTKLAASGDDLANAFSVFLTYPFVDESVGRDPQVARNLHMGDYTNLSITMELRLDEGLPTIGLPPQSLPVEQVCTTLADVQKQIRDRFGDGPVPLDKLLAYLEGVDNLCDGAAAAVNKCLSNTDLNRVATCLGNRLGTPIRDLTQGAVDATCDLLGIDPEQCPQLDGGGLPLPLPSLTLSPLPGLPRAGFGTDARPDTSDWSTTHGPTLGQLTEVYDPALVGLMVPGMVTPR